MFYKLNLDIVHSMFTNPKAEQLFVPFGNNDTHLLGINNTVWERASKLTKLSSITTWYKKGKE